MQTVVEAQSKKLMYMHWPTYQIRKKGRDFRKLSYVLQYIHLAQNHWYVIISCYAIYVVVPR